MSYTQGTNVGLTAKFSDPDTGVPLAPTDVVFTVRSPTGEVTVSRLSDSDVTNLGGGRYRTYFDTSPEAGVYEVQVEGVDDSPAKCVAETSSFVVKQGIFQ